MNVLEKWEELAENVKEDLKKLQKIQPQRKRKAKALVGKSIEKHGERSNKKKTNFSTSRLSTKTL